MISVNVPIILLICFTVKTYGTLGINERRESIVGILLGTIENEIQQLNDLVRRNVKFEQPRCNGSLERVFRSRLDLFFGVPREMLTSGMDLTNVDVTVLNEFFQPYHTAPSPCPTHANSDCKGVVNVTRDSARGSSRKSRRPPKTRKSPSEKSDRVTTKTTAAAMVSRLNSQSIGLSGPSNSLSDIPSRRSAGRTRTRVSSSSNGRSGRTSNISTAVTVGEVNRTHSTTGTRTRLPLIAESDCGGVNLTASAPASLQPSMGSQRFPNERSVLAARADPGGLIGPTAAVGAGVASGHIDDGSNDADFGGPDVRRADCARPDVLPKGLDGDHAILTPSAPEITGAGSRAARPCSGPRPEPKTSLAVPMVRHTAAGASSHRTAKTDAAVAAATPETVGPSPLGPERCQKRSRLQGRRRYSTTPRLLHHSTNRKVRRLSRTVVLRTPRPVFFSIGPTVRRSRRRHRCIDQI